MTRAWPLVLAACWTGPDEPPPAPPPVAAPAPPSLDVRLERTACFGKCPVYSVELRNDGRVIYNGVQNVQVTGPVRARFAPAELARISRAVDAARFFELDEDGHLPPQCTDGGECSFALTGCSDTPHAILTIRRGRRTHRVDDARCGDNARLEELEDLIDRVAGTRDWVGR